MSDGFRITPEAALKAIGIAQSFESSLRFCVSTVFRLLLGYTAGLPPTAISFNGAVSLGLGVLLEVPAGVISDVIGPTKACVIGYIAQAAAAMALFFAIAVHPENVPLMWMLITVEAVLDAAGNALLSGSREVAYQSSIQNASAALPEAERKTLEVQFLSLSEQYGRILLIILPGITLLAMYVLFDMSSPTASRDHWLVPVLACGWVYLAINIAAIGRTFAPSVERASSNFSATTRKALHTVKNFSRIQWATSFSYVVLTFLFGIVHGFLPVSLLRTEHPWIAQNLWFPIVIVNLMFIIARLLRSYILPRLVKALSPRTLLFWGSGVITMLGLLLSSLPTVMGVVGGSAAMIMVWVTALALFPIPYDTAHGAATRPSLGVLLQSLKDGGVTTSTLSMTAAVSSVLSCIFSLWLTTSGIGVPSVGLIGLVMVVGGLGAAALSFLMRNEAIDNEKA